MKLPLGDCTSARIGARGSECRGSAGKTHRQQGIRAGSTRVGKRNVLWAAAKLHEAVPAVLSVVPAVARRVPQQVEKMIPQALSNCMWASVNLQEVAPAVLMSVPAVAEHVPPNVEHMIPQRLSNCLWAAANLHEGTPAVRTAVPALAECIKRNAGGFTEQGLTNCLWAAARGRTRCPSGCACAYKSHTNTCSADDPSRLVKLPACNCQAARCFAKRALMFTEHRGTDPFQDGGYDHTGFAHVPLGSYAAG